MNDRMLFFLLYLATPVTLLFGLLVMYLLIGDHEWFGYMAGGYTVLLAVLYVVKISIFKKMMRGKSATRPENENG
ncbi:hypothetical protein KQI65_04690 [bacterium]|nr:hypothetical protein [bacterium]